MSLVDVYNNISRFSLKLPFAISHIDKNTTDGRLRIKGNNDPLKAAKLKLYAALIGFKYYRQSNTEDIDEQERFLGKAKHIIEWNPDLGLTLFDCMAYVKNDGFIVQRKITGHFRELLRDLEPADRITLNKYIDEGAYLSPSVIERIKTFFLENVGFALSKTLESSGEKLKHESSDGNATRRSFLTGCENLKFEQPKWLNYMKRELMNPIVMACLNAHKYRPDAFKAPIEPAEAVKALDGMQFEYFLKLAPLEGEGEPNYDFSAEFMKDTASAKSFSEATKEKSIRVPHHPEMFAKKTGADVRKITDVRCDMGKRLRDHFLDTIVALRNQEQNKNTL